MENNFKTPSLLESLFPVIFLIGLLTLNVFTFDDALAGSNQFALLFAAAVAVIFNFKNGLKWDTLLDGIVKSISSAMPAVLILLFIGALSGTWLISGIVPAMIYYGLKILSPSIFLFAACAVCSFVSLASGSSWSTIATVGIALLGIGKTLGFSDGMIAGAIISGAYFGDKMSPLSDTTNLAPAMAGTKLFTHIRYMVLTTGPSILITLLIFLIIGFTGNTEAEVQDIDSVLIAIDSVFEINLWLFLVPLTVVVLIIKKVAALPALFIGTVLGGVFAIIFQPNIIENISQVTDNYSLSSYITVLMAMYGDINIVTDNEMVSGLLSSGGMSGMLNTIWLVLCAMSFGGVMEAGGMLQRISDSIIKRVKSTGSLIGSTVGTCLFFNVTTSDQYIAIVVPGRMFASSYRKWGLKPENLSRTLEDSATVTSVLIPWNTCGATQAAVLGVATMTYLPFCFFNIISPFMSLLFGYLNIKIARLVESED
ncbi:MAG: Na+/H+ antiporter NhaC [Bacteroidetes bacterium]|nr:Na+/H+ antiporter NhaC [Bacteroidia bacterium]PCH67731.1 MAG: Na+/H+ antiporter NhaC [Bacteroidota bacterium]